MQMIKITIDSGMKYKNVETFKDYSLFAVFVLYGICFLLNFFSFIEWTYSATMFRATIGLILLGSIFYCTYNVCKKAMKEYDLKIFGKER
jgi:hypothetical protein